MYPVRTVLFCDAACVCSCVLSVGTVVCVQRHGCNFYTVAIALVLYIYYGVFSCASREVSGLTGGVLLLLVFFGIADYVCLVI